MSERYRLLFLAEDMSRGGGPRSILSIACALHRAGHHVVLATEGGRLLEPALAAGIPHYPLPPAQVGRARGQISFANMARLLRVVRREQIQIIHCFRHWSLYLAVATSPVHCRPLVYTHNTLSHRFEGSRIPARLTATSQQFARSLAEVAGVPLEQIAVIPNRIDLRHFRPDSLIPRPAARAALGLPVEVPVIAFISRFEQIALGKAGGLWRFLEALPELAAKLPALVVLVAGIGSDGPEVLARCDAANSAIGREAVRPLGLLPDTMDLLAAADMVVGTGRCTMEAMACGLPVAVVGEEGYAGRVSPGTIAAIADTNFSGRNVAPGELQSRLAPELAEVLLDGTVATELADFGREYVRRELEVSGGVPRYEVVYAQALEGGVTRLSERLAAFWRMSAYLVRRTRHLAG